MSVEVLIFAGQVVGLLPIGQYARVVPDRRRVLRKAWLVTGHFMPAALRASRM